MSTIAVDVGGTHTDLYARRSGEGTAVHEKVPTTADDPTQGVMNALKSANIEIEQVETLMHGSTIATNAVIEGKYPTTPFITTDGFRDLIEIGRYHREELYDPYQTKPDPLTSRQYRYTVPGRIDENGTETEPLDEDAIREIARELDEMGVESVGIGFINSYANPDHERRAKEVIEEEVDDIYVSASSEVSGKLGSIARFNSTIMNAALEPVMADYLDRLDNKLVENGFDGRFYVIRSDGGVVGAAQAKSQAESTILSGPAAGVKGSQTIGEIAGSSNIIGMDMGGTSTDVSLIEDGEPLVTTEYEVKFDIPLVRPMLDVTTIGSGGGSIAWIDDGGSLRVGPQSAGAEPGPVCYDMGGTEPTITDANLVLGRLDPENFLGGRRQLNAEKAEEAIQGLAEELDMSVLEAAEGILEIANESMAAAVRETTIERGQDPRDYTLVGFGGCGPMHASEVAARLDVPSVVIPSASGVLSAVGGAMMDVQQNIDRTFYMPVASTDHGDLQTQFEELEEEVYSMFSEEDVGTEEIDVTRIAEMRYIGQTYEVDVPVQGGSLDETTIDELVAQFQQRHEQEYGIASDEFPVTFVNLRVTGRTETGDRTFQSPSPEKASAGDDETRDVYFDGQWHETTILHQAGLESDMDLHGPAIVTGAHSTVTLPPGMNASVDSHGNIRVTTNERRNP